jgi:hypothetical protein
MSKLILLLLLVTFTISKNITVINDNNFDEEVQDGHGKPWLLIFYLKTCPHCNNANEAMNNMKESQDFRELNVNLGHIDCSGNIMSCMRFNITRVPYIVYLDKNRMFEFDSLPSEHSLLKFIKEEKTLEGAKDIPPAFSYVGLVFKLLGDTVTIANDFFADNVKKLGYNIEWSSQYTISLFLIGMIIIIVIEYFFLTLCCVKKRKPTVHAKTD